jgi:extradiol dioxygenase family protein
MPSIMGSIRTTPDAYVGERMQTATESLPVATERPRFHIAFPVDDLAAARHFYGEILGCPEGRSAEQWVDFDLFGHQVVAHRVDGRRDNAHNPVDGDAVPVPHFGLLMQPSDWRTLADRLIAAGVEFVIEPHTRFAGEPGEQSTMFVLDPSGNALEFKAFAHDRMIFAK